jgi:hypothetical protein
MGTPIEVSHGRCLLLGADAQSIYEQVVMQYCVSLKTRPKDNRKDHVMMVCKLIFANLAMWTRNHYFPATYAHATCQ